MQEVQITTWYAKSFTMGLWINRTRREIKYRLKEDQLLLEHPDSLEIIKFDFSILIDWHRKEWIKINHRLVGIIRFPSRESVAIVVKVDNEVLGTIRGEHTKMELIELLV